MRAEIFIGRKVSGGEEFLNAMEAVELEWGVRSLRDNDG